MEILQAVILTPEEWTPENGLVTAAQKIQRNKIAKEFAKEIEVCFVPIFPPYFPLPDELISPCVP